MLIVIPLALILLVLARRFYFDNCAGVFGLVLGLPMLRALSRRRKRRLGAVLWVRRFHRGAQSRTLVQFWHAVVWPWGQLITLWDEDVGLRLGRAIGGALVVWVGFMLVHWYGFGSPASREDMFDRMIEYCAYLLTCAGYVVVKARRSSSTMRQPGDIESVLRHARRMRSEAFVNWSGPGAVHCPRDDEELWRSAILKLAPEVGAVIVDYGGAPSACVDWEAATLLRICGPEKLVLAVPENETGPPAPTSEMESTLRRLCESSPMPRVIVYPRQPPRRPFSRQYEAVVRPAQRILGMATLTESVKQG